MKPFRTFPNKSKQRGNVFAMLFAAVALTGVLAAVGMQTLTGPVTTVTRVTQRNVADTQLLMNAKIIVNAAITGVADGDADGDGLIEPSAYVSPSGGETAPVNGGFLPTDLGLSLTDPWGTKYGYCVWDHGTTNTSANRLTGDNTASAPTQIVLAIIAAGPDKVFQTTCSAFSGGLVQVTKAGGADDLHFKYTYAEASANSNGLWSINVSDQAKAELKNAAGSQVNVTIDRDTGVGDFLGLTTGVISAKTAETIAMDGALLLDAAGATSDTCTAAEKGSIRLNAGLDSIEICDGAGGFFDLTPAYWEASGNDIYATNTGNVGIGTPSPSQKLDVQGNTNISANIVAGGTGAIGGDFTVNTDALAVDAANKRVGIGKSPDEALDVIGNAAIDGSAAVTGGLTVDTETLAVDADGDMVGIGTASPEHKLDIAGESDMGALGSMETADAVLHIDDGTASLYADGRAIISDAGLILGTTGANGLQLVTNEAQRILIADDGTVSITGNTGISGAVNLWSTLNVTGIANFDSGTLYVDVPDGRVGIGTTDPLTKLDVTGGIKIGGDTLCNISKAGMVAWNSGVLQLCGADGNWTSLAAIEKLDDIGDVDVPSPNNDDVLAWNGTYWVAKNIALLGPANINPAGNDGSIQFRDGNDLGADPDYFHWDKDNHRLGIGTTMPDRLLHAVQTEGSTSNGASVIFEKRHSTIPSAGSQSSFGLRFDIENSAGAIIPGAGIYGGFSDLTAGAEAGVLRFYTGTGGNLNQKLVIGLSNVGIGMTTPQSRLHVAGGIQLGDDTDACPGASNVKLGTLRFNGGNLQVCKSTGWSGVLSVAGGGAVAFSAGKNATQSINSTWSKVVWEVEDFDSNNNFSSSRFTPTVAGQYLITAGIYVPNSSGTTSGIAIRKNGATVHNGWANDVATPSVSAVVDMNGTSDYIEIYAYSSVAATLQGNTSNNYFTGALLGGESGGSEGGGSGGAGSMLPGWPDAFMCQVSGKPYIYWLVADNGTQVIYRLLRNTAGDTYIRFNPSTKAFVDTNDAGQAGDCAANSWSIDDLYAQGRAFNFVGGGGGSGTNVGFMAARTGASQSLTGSAWSQVILPTEIRDDGGDNYNPATGVYTVPQTGYYSVYGRAVVSGTGGTASYILIDYDNNTSNQACYSSNQGDSNSYYISCAGIVHLTAGQTLRLKYWYTGSSPTTSNAEFRAVLLNAGSGGDTLASLSCASGEIPKWNGTAWECAEDGRGSGGATTIFSNASGALRYAVFNGVSGTVVYKSGGVSDVIRTGTGEYVVKWTTPFANDNYVILGSCNPQGYSGARFSISGNRISGHQYEGVHPSQAGITCRIATSSSSTDSDLIVVAAFDLNSPYVEAGASFNGSGGASVYAQKNVSSITRTSNGKYTVTWSTPFPDNKYVVLGSCNGWGTSGASFTLEGNNIVGHTYEGLKTNSVNIGCRNPSASDSDLIHVIAVRLDEGFAKKGAVFNGVGGITNASYSAGVTGATRIGNGTYDVLWSSPFSSEDYVILGSCNAYGTGGLIQGTHNKANGTNENKARVQCRDGTNSLADTDYGAVIAFDPTTDDIGEPAGGGVSGGGKFVDGDDPADAVYTDGKVGIGTTAPTQDLDVVGTVTSDRMIFKSVAADPPIGGSTYWSSDGTHVWRDTGNIGIGTTSPVYKLDVGGSARFAGSALFNSTVDINDQSGPARLFIRPGDDVSTADQRMYTSDGSTADYWRFLAYGKSYTSTAYQRKLRIMSYDGGTYTDVMTLMANGNVGFGTVAPVQKLDVDGNIRITGNYYANGNLLLGQNNTATSVYGSTGAANYLQLAASDSANDGARIILYGRTHGSSGRIYLQSSSNSAADLVHQIIRRRSDGTTYAVKYTYGDGVTRFYGTNGSGSCYIDGDGPSTTCTSDERLKKDIEPIPNALESLVKVRGVSFNWKEEFKNDPGRKKYGVIAQELQAAFPDLVVEAEDGYLQASMDGLIPVLVESVKELKAENDELRRVNASILKRLEALEAHAMH